MAWFTLMLVSDTVLDICSACLHDENSNGGQNIFSSKIYQFIDGGKFKCTILCGRKIIIVYCPLKS